MKFMFNLHCDNDAFADDPAPEIARILKEVAAKIESRGLTGFFETIRDVNGNDVGRFALKPDDYR